MESISFFYRILLVHWNEQLQLFQTAWVRISYLYQFRSWFILGYYERQCKANDRAACKLTQPQRCIICHKHSTCSRPCERMRIKIRVSIRKILTSNHFIASKAFIVCKIVIIIFFSHLILCYVRNILRKIEDKKIHSISNLFFHWWNGQGRFVCRKFSIWFYAELMQISEWKNTFSQMFIDAQFCLRKNWSSLVFLWFIDSFNSKLFIYFFFFVEIVFIHTANLRMGFP